MGPGGTTGRALQRKDLQPISLEVPVIICKYGPKVSDVSPIVNGLLKSATDLESVELCNVAMKFNTLRATSGGPRSRRENAKPKLPVGPNSKRDISVNGVSEFYIQTLESSFHAPAAL